ncbi:MAG: PD-(D/E)XK nuclease family protein, partial [Verrucomicrobiae bacterium]|nr:PD-(D/E)XK nuclease family protein [Verrucomicrobiae bacterium]
RELVELLRAYEETLAKQRLVDDADVFRLAAENASLLPTDALVLRPADLDLSLLERRFLDALPPHQQLVLQVDEPRTPSFTETFCAVGETNEVREVLRRCLANGWPLDQVEVLHTDTETYVARFYELAESLGVPVTFSEGIPVRYSRPGRALAAWLSWLDNDFPQSKLLEMIRDGLLADFPAELATHFRTVQIGLRRERYLSQLDAEIAALQRRLNERAAETDEEGEMHPEPRTAWQRRLEALQALRKPLLQLLDLATRPILEATGEFLQKHARCANELDNYAREAILERIAELCRWLQTTENKISPSHWLQTILRETRVLGRGPRPGHLYVTGWETGGHSGRPHTFLIGLDSDRFPPAPRPDPLLLDDERAHLSEDLPTSQSQHNRLRQRFEQLFARLRGTVTGSYSCRDIAEGAEKFAGVKLSSEPATAATAPLRESEATSETEWWLWRLCMATPVDAPAELIGDRYPWLRRGLRAAAQRKSIRPTEFDGVVPEAGPVLDPADSPERLCSAHSLETAGACPLRYFFRYALGLEPPEELRLDPNRWLPASEFGLLLHEVFCRHLRDGVPLQKALDDCIAHWRENFPPPTEGVFRRDCRRMEVAIRIFEAEESDWRRQGKFLAFEHEIKGVPMKLADGSTIYLRGRIDRVDETPEGLVLWDYKTGSLKEYLSARSDPFKAGRILQHAIYIALAEADFKKQVAEFVYFFPTHRAHGEYIRFARGTLMNEAPAKLAALRQKIAKGNFIATTKADDCKYCDFLEICRDPATVTAQSKLKQEGES